MTGNAGTISIPTNDITNKKSGPNGPLIFLLVAKHLEDIIKIVILT